MTQALGIRASAELQQTLAWHPVRHNRCKPWVAAAVCVFLLACSQFSTPLPSDRPLPQAPAAATPSQPASASAAAGAVPGTCAGCADHAAPTTAPISRGAAIPAPLADAPQAHAVGAGSTPASSGAAVAPMPSTAEANTTAGADGAKPYFINIGAFAVAANANNAYQKVAAAGITVFTQEIDTPKGRLTRVRAGPFATRSDADAVAKRIRALELDAVVMR